MAPEKITQALRWRYAVKTFDPAKKIPAAEWNALEEALWLAPSSYGLQPWKFLVIQNVELRKQLRAVSRDQSAITDASHLVVFVAKEKMDEAHIDKHIARTAAVRGVDVASLQPWRKGMIDSLLLGPRAQTIEAWAQRQTFIPMGVAVTAAAMMEIDTCPLEGIQPLEYDRILGVEPGWKTIAALAFGYRSINDKYANAKKSRFAKEDVVIYK